MPRYRNVIGLVVLGLVLLAAGLIAGFFLPFWDYSKTYAPIIGTPAPSSGMGVLAASALLAGMRR